MDREETFRKISAVGRAALTLGIENSHSGNISIKGRDEGGREILAITATGSQKGELNRDKICYPALDKINYGYFKSSSETDIHAGILRIPGINATVHGHTKTATIVTFDDTPFPKVNPRPSMFPVDTLGIRYFGEEVPVDWFAVGSGSREMADTVTKRLETHRACIVQTHGTFAGGATVEEAFFYLCMIEYCGEVIFYADILGLDHALARKKAAEIAPILKKSIPEYTNELDGRIDFADEPETVEMFSDIGFRAFESGYSPFHTGSMSLRCSNTMLYLPKASLPRGLHGPMLELPLKPDAAEEAELAMHRFIYKNTPLKSVVHCHISEAEAVVLSMMQGGAGPAKLIPIDVEGGFLYPSVPVLPSNPDPDVLCRALLEYKIAIVEYGGVWSIGEQAIGEAIRHISSVKDICYYRIMAKMRGLDVASMEPARAKNW